jgi:oligosaccharide repeat unit polymerase
MTPLVILCFLAAVTACFVSLAWSKDFFSPDKFFLGSLLLFYLDIYFHEYDFFVYFCYFVLLCIFSLIVFIQPRAKSHFFSYTLRVNNKDADLQPEPLDLRTQLVFFCLSIPAVLAQYILILEMGGLENYVNSIGFRVIEHAGFGYLTVITTTFGVINLYYFACILQSRVSLTSKAMLFWVHFSIFVFSALLTSSRGGLLVNVVLMIVLYSILKKQLRLAMLLFFIILVMTIASVLEVARSGYSLSAGELQTGLSAEGAGQSASYAWTTYGLQALQLISEGDAANLNAPLGYGMTYVAALTNFIPRAIWPGKPDTGGVLLTREYAADEYRGATNLSPGIISEAVINFGFFAGLPIGFVLYGVTLFIALRQYSALMSDANRLAKDRTIVFNSVRAAYVTWYLMGLGVGEFASIMVNFITVLITIYLVNRVLAYFNLDKSSGKPLSTVR